MKRLRRLLYFMSVLAFAVSLSGCWDYRDIEQLNMVAGIAVDKSADNKYKVTMEIVHLESSGTQPQLQSKKVESYGDTLLDALRNGEEITGRKMYYSHTKVIIISQDIAKEGIAQIVDWIIRDQEPRLEADLLISKDKSAQDILNPQSVGGEICSLNIYDKIRSQKEVSKSPETGAYLFFRSLYSEGKSPVVAVINVVTNYGKRALELSGAAVFKEDKLIGFLDEDDTQYLLFVKDEVKRGVLPEMEAGENSKNSISLEVYDSHTKITPEYSGGKASINIDINTIVSIDEQGSKRNYTDEKGREMLKNNTEKSLEAKIKETIKMVQDKYGTDIFEFGEFIKIGKPSAWREIEPEWDNLFKDLEVNVNVKLDIKGSGVMSNPVKAGV